MTEFTHLHVHSDRSILDSIIKIKKLVKRCRELGMKSVAVTDHGVMAGAVQLYQEATKTEDDDGNPITPIKPVIGMEAYLSPTDDHTLREKIEGLPPYYHLTLIAKNAEGVSDLYELSSRGFLEGFYHKPRISLPMATEKSRNLICLGGCVKGPVNWSLFQNDEKRARHWITRLKEAFKEDFYLELMDHGLEWQKSLNIAVTALAEAYSIQCIPTNDCHFLQKKDHYTHSLMMCVQLKKTYKELVEEGEGGMLYPMECYVKSPEEMKKLFGEVACRRTQEIVDKVDIQLELDVPHFPRYKE